MHWNDTFLNLGCAINYCDGRSCVVQNLALQNNIKTIFITGHGYRTFGSKFIL